jgi:DNA-binding transcriptional LysR family regulator
MMTLKQLEVLIALAECRSFARTAMRMGTTQSAVSHTLRTLEKDLGVRLAERDASSFKITDAGQQLLQRAREMTVLAEVIQQEMMDTRELKTGTLRIGSFGPTSTMHLLPPWLGAFKKMHPKVQVRIDEDADEVIDQWLLEKRVELGFVLEPDDRFEIHTVAYDEFVVILPINHPLSKLKRIPIQALNGEEFIMSEAGGGPVISGLLYRHGVHPKILHHLTQIISILTLVQQGLAISMAARLALPDPPTGVVYQSLSPALPRRVGLACLQVDRLSPLALAFWKLATSSRPHRFGASLPVASPASRMGA